jgi:hypothetical protein
MPVHGITYDKGVEYDVPLELRVITQLFPDRIELDEGLQGVEVYPTQRDISKRQGHCALRTERLSK